MANVLSVVGTYAVSMHYGGSMYGPEETKYVLSSSDEGAAILTYYHMVPDSGASSLEYTGSLTLADGIVTFHASTMTDNMKHWDGKAGKYEPAATDSDHLERFLVMPDGALALLSESSGTTVKQLGEHDVILEKEGRVQEDVVEALQ
mmetsp:Transcript_90441/g.229984  ORF Transcript_90441/g.229984 Transcript_90441/m.229984 type:complete len:147 (-) Transcript_90441:159-599(-)|eukprot:CAMPEP_0183426856 /NCGR_PEP_ID=MMETSP0370-20130417/39941_1 /TAXON_ID=268820 /ORGANISM="Peridinium aciculiferum, Strain PAER-2" /LENGTH=146 /DNA_ID=CAMNT_0025611325 /DNA_START=67 /DNA_END=507 /DNA_ORIENTATION=-